MLSEESHYLALAAAFARGRLDRLALDDDEAIDAGLAAGLPLHRFKRSATLPRVRRVIGALRGLGAGSLLDVGSGRGAFLWPLVDALPELTIVAIDQLPHRVADIDAVRRGGVPRVVAARMDAGSLALPARAVDV